MISLHRSSASAVTFGLIVVIILIQAVPCLARSTVAVNLPSRRVAVPAPAQVKVKIVGAFTNMKHDREHAWGYTVQLWQQGSRLFGFFQSSAGLQGDTPTGLLEAVRFNAATGRLSFRARLTMGVHFTEQDEQIPSRDIFEFSGTLRKQDLRGVLRISELSIPSLAPLTEKITLRRSSRYAELMMSARTYSEWKQRADEILKFRGPRW